MNNLETLQKALDKIFTDDDEFFNSVFGTLKGNSVAEREKEVKMRLYKLQGWLIQCEKYVKELFSAFQAGQVAKEQALRELFKNRPHLNDERFKEFSIDTYEDQVNKYLTFIGEQDKWCEKVEKVFDETFSSDKSFVHVPRAEYEGQDHIDHRKICEFAQYVRGMERLWNNIPNTKVFNPNTTDEGFGDGTYCSLNAYVADFLKKCDAVLGWDSKKNAEDIQLERKKELLEASGKETEK